MVNMTDEIESSYDEKIKGLGMEEQIIKIELKLQL